MRSRRAADEDEDAEGDAQLQEEVVERERGEVAHRIHGKARKGSEDATFRNPIFIGFNSRKDFLFFPCHSVVSVGNFPHSLVNCRSICASWMV